jgi:hypothetical protein
MHRLASVHVEDPMRSLNRWLVWLSVSASARHHCARAVAACPITGDGCDGTACRGALPMTRLDGAVMRVELRARSGMAVRSSHQLAGDESALITSHDESAHVGSRDESAHSGSRDESALVVRHECLNCLALLGNRRDGAAGTRDGRSDAFAAARPLRGRRRGAIRRKLWAA